MFDSAIGLIILLVAVLPGAAYTWGFERQAGSFRVSLADRTLRFVGASVLFHLALAPLNWLLYRLLVPFGRAVDGGDFLLLWAAVGVLAFLRMRSAMPSVGCTAPAMLATRRGGGRDGSSPASARNGCSGRFWGMTPLRARGTTSLHRGPTALFEFG